MNKTCFVNLGLSEGGDDDTDNDWSGDSDATIIFKCNLQIVEYIKRHHSVF